MLKYSIQCDKLRQSPEGDLVWHTMMNGAERIYLSEFLDECDPEDTHFEGEDPRQVFSEMSDVAFYRVIWMGNPVYFYQTSGFEFFFTIDGEQPSYCEPMPMHHPEFMRYGLAEKGLLMSSNSPLLNNSFGFETTSMEFSPGIEIIQSENGLERIRVIESGIPVAGLLLNGNLVVEAQVASYMESNSPLYEAKEKIEEFIQEPLQFSPNIAPETIAWFSANLTTKSAEPNMGSSFEP